MEHEIKFRVRYQETDQMGVVYHGNYFQYFEMGRTEMLRDNGITYREMDEAGEFCVVVQVDCSYKKPAKYDDLLTLKTHVKRITRVKIEHEHFLFRGDELLAIGHITLAVVDREGNIKRVPDWMKPEE
ncbi:MAG: acyl-CoA thioesterase [Thermoguttaceae bacterium]